MGSLSGQSRDGDYNFFLLFFNLLIHLFYYLSRRGMLSHKAEDLVLIRCLIMSVDLFITLMLLKFVVGDVAKNYNPWERLICSPRIQSFFYCLQKC